MQGGAVRERVMKAAARIGPVEVDHGMTGCVTPDAAAYIHKAEDRMSAKAG
jgi:hypothetical protein